ncbi:MAG: hypothetical protein V4805_06595, partial [Pseudomonadota bacterium]
TDCIREQARVRAAANGNRGQGLFVAKTYMAKMGGTIGVQNVMDGVSFVLSLQRGMSSPNATKHL